MDLEGIKTMKPKIPDKSDSENDEFQLDIDSIGISWEDSLGKEIKSFWESFETE